LKEYQAFRSEKPEQRFSKYDRQSVYFEGTIIHFTLNQMEELAHSTLKIESRAANRRLAQRRVTWLIGHSTSHQLLWCIDSFVLRDPPLRQAPNCCVQYKLTNPPFLQAL
jgi:hypothetical protein